MVYRLRKKTIFLFSILFVGVLSFFSTYIRTNATKDFSLLVPRANADVVSTPCSSCGCGWTETQCYNYSSGLGDGCCSGAGPSSGSADAAADAGACAGACE